MEGVKSGTLLPALVWLVGVTRGAASRAGAGWCAWYAPGLGVGAASCRLGRNCLPGPGLTRNETPGWKKTILASGRLSAMTCLMRKVHPVGHCKMPQYAVTG